jgi:broad specificity phosphatase PhoE
MEIHLLRHASTKWNEEKKYLGATDIPLSEKGEAEARGWKLPISAENALFISSSMLRARQTMELLFPGQPYLVDERLREMHLGSWEGKTREEVAPFLSEQAKAQEYNGMDFREHGGETLAEVQARMLAWVADLQKTGAKKVVAVSHRATITSFYALATGWKIDSKPAERLLFPRLHSFFIDTDSQIRINRVNIPLESGSFGQIG